MRSTLIVVMALIMQPVLLQGDFSAQRLEIIENCINKIDTIYTLSIISQVEEKDSKAISSLLIRNPQSELTDRITYGTGSVQWAKASKKLSEELVIPVMDFAQACSIVDNSEMGRFLERFISEENGDFFSAPKNKYERALQYLIASSIAGRD